MLIRQCLLHFASISLLPAFTKYGLRSRYYLRLIREHNAYFHCFLLKLSELFCSFSFKPNGEFSRASLFSPQPLKTLSPSIVTTIRLLKLQIAFISSTSRAHDLRFRRFHYDSRISNSRISFYFSLSFLRFSQRFMCVFCVTAFRFLYQFS
ncbi:hypothetical protein RYX36_034830 [Vicia faba]